MLATRGQKQGQEFAVTWKGTQVGRVTNINPNLTRDTKEVTSFDDSDYKRFISSRAEGDVSMDIQYDPTNSNSQSAVADWRSGTTGDLQIDPNTPVSGDETWSATVIPTGFSTTYPDGDLVTRTIQFKIDGQPTITVQP